MTPQANQIRDNLRRVQGRIEYAAAKAGRSPDDVRLVAVTKYVGVAETSALLAAGCNTLGESRPQQLWEKSAAPELAPARWHLIGHLQRNKVRRTLPLVELIHSVDSLRLIESIDEYANLQKQPAEVLLEVNCSGDHSKHGLSANELRQMLPALEGFRNVVVKGLMTMAAWDGDERVAAKNFEALRNLRDELRNECPENVILDELSMGMSRDFEVAIREGSTLVRIGSTLFEGLT